MADYPSFPVMSKPPVLGVQQGFLDNTLASMMENGMVITRARSGNPLKRTWMVQYKNNPETDRAQLDDFVRNVVKGGAGAFYFQDPRPPKDVVLVRFAANKPPQITDDGPATQEDGTQGLTYSWSMELQEV